MNNTGTTPSLIDTLLSSRVEKVRHDLRVRRGLGKEKLTFNFGSAKSLGPTARLIKARRRAISGRVRARDSRGWTRGGRHSIGPRGASERLA